MNLKMKFKGTVLSRKELVNIFAGDTKPPRNNSGTASDSPWDCMGGAPLNNYETCVEWIANNCDTTDGAVYCRQNIRPESSI